jgi:hypothetical protein
MLHPTSPHIRWLFLDLNSYFASIEQELRPELRHRPIAVVPLTADTTCAIAASYEAKAFGVRTGTQVGGAKRLFPGIELVEARHELYVDYHHRIVEAVECGVPVAAVMSIDEMAASLVGREQPLITALDLGRRIKIPIRSRVGLTLRCSIGVVPNRYLAKIASDHKTAMRLRGAHPWTTHLSLSIKFAVSRAAARKLHNSGIPQSLWSHGITVIESQDGQTLVDALVKLWAERPQGPQYQKPLYVGVRLGDLVPDHLHTLSLFSGLAGESRLARLSSTIGCAQPQIWSRHADAGKYTSGEGGGADQDRVHGHSGSLLETAKALSLATHSAFDHRDNH